MTAIAEQAIGWAAEAGHTATREHVLAALCAADLDNQAADQTMTDAAGDLAAMGAVVRDQISFIEVYILRVQAALGLTVTIEDTDSWWAYLANQAHTG
jgi:hypothetical protein